MKLPTCCGKRMKTNIELSRFIELQCEKCGDIVYIKKSEQLEKPKMIDD